MVVGTNVEVILQGEIAAALTTQRTKDRMVHERWVSHI